MSQPIADRNFITYMIGMNIANVVNITEGDVQKTSKLRYSESAGMKNTAGSKMAFLSFPGRPVADPF